MPQQTLIQPLHSQKSTCEDCPKFKDYQDRGRGLCLVFDKVVRKRHQITSDCVQHIQSQHLNLFLTGI